MNFKQFCLDNRLRYSLTDKEPISHTRSRKFPNDHLYDGFNGFVGVHVEREKKGIVNHIVRKLIELGCIRHQMGDLEANLKCPLDKIQKVAKFLKCKRGKAREMPSNPLIK